MDSDAIETIASICHVPSARAIELLEAANGQLERAIEIHLTASPPRPRADEGLASSANAVKETLATPSSHSKEKSRRRTLDAYFSPPSLADSETVKLKLSPHSRLTVSSGVEDSTDLSSKKQKTDKTLEVKQPPYAVLAKALADMTATTKRTTKISVLTMLFSDIIHSVGGISDRENRDNDAVLLTCTIDLILGKLSCRSSRSDSTEQTDATVLQVSGSAVSTAVQTVTGASRQELSKAYRKSGDLGDVAASLFVPTLQKQFFSFTKPQPPLTIRQVHEQLRAIANVSAGKGSQKERLGLLVKLLRRANDKEELRFLVRSLLGNMRLGATMKTIIVALAAAVEDIHRGANSDVTTQPETTKALEKVFNICPRLDRINAALLVGGVPYAIEHCSFEIGCPIQPMLADPVHSFSEIESFLSGPNGVSLEAVAEFKYDGVRCQAHFNCGELKLFSRNMLEMTQQFPDVVKYILESKSDDITSFIIDSEIVGVQPDEKCENGFRLLPFQDLSTRRGTKTADSADRVAVRVFAFDLVAVNSQSLLNVSLGERQAVLQQKFRATSGFGFAEAKRLVGYNESEIQASLQTAIDLGAEGLMIKLSGTEKFPATYESGTRGKTWKKVKKDYVGGFADTIDVVPIGAWYGNGRKAQKGFLSPVLFAVYDDEDGVFRSISRCMSFSDAMYEAMRNFYLKGVPYPAGVGLEASTTNEVSAQIGQDMTAAEELEAELDEMDDDKESTFTDERVNCFTSRPPTSTVITNESPPIWFKPLEVFEVSFADLSLSKAHTAASGLVADELGRGVALRFPRFKRRRPDKLVEQATTCIDIAHLFHQQSKLRDHGD